MNEMQKEEFKFILLFFYKIPDLLWPVCCIGLLIFMLVNGFFSFNDRRSLCDFALWLVLIIIAIGIPAKLFQIFYKDAPVKFAIKDGWIEYNFWFWDREKRKRVEEIERIEKKPFEMEFSLKRFLLSYQVVRRVEPYFEIKFRDGERILLYPYFYYAIFPFCYLYKFQERKKRYRKLEEIIERLRREKKEEFVH